MEPILTTTKSYAVSPSRVLQATCTKTQSAVPAARIKEQAARRQSWITKLARFKKTGWFEFFFENSTNFEIKILKKL
jgi:hypothetical protein